MHLQDAVSTRYFREIVAHFDVVRVVGVPLVEVDIFVDILASLGRNARRGNVVPAGVLRVDRAVEVVVIRAGQRVPVETFLGCHVVGAEVGSVADGELDVSLGLRFVGSG